MACVMNAGRGVGHMSGDLGGGQQLGLGLALSRSRPAVARDLDRVADNLIDQPPVDVAGPESLSESVLAGPAVGLDHLFELDVHERDLTVTDRCEEALVEGGGVLDEVVVARGDLHEVSFGIVAARDGGLRQQVFAEELLERVDPQRGVRRFLVKARGLRQLFIAGVEFGRGGFVAAFGVLDLDADKARLAVTAFVDEGDVEGAAVAGQGRVLAARRVFPPHVVDRFEVDGGNNGSQNAGGEGQIVAQPCEQVEAERLRGKQVTVEAVLVDQRACFLIRHFQPDHFGDLGGEEVAAFVGGSLGDERADGALAPVLVGVGADGQVLLLAPLGLEQPCA